jgi:hypothetical protein
VSVATALVLALAILAGGYLLYALLRGERL